MAEVKFIEAPKDLMDKIPTEGIILMKTYPSQLVRDQKDKMKTWGSISRSGYFTINGKPIEGWSYMGSSLTISHTLMLNLADESHRRLYAILTLSDQWKGVVSESQGKRKSGSRFYFENTELEAQKYMEDVARADEMVDTIRGLDEGGLNRVATWFSIGGSEQVKRASLRKMTESEDGRKKLGEIFLSPDRALLELIAEAKTKGNAGLQEGLWVNQSSGIYYWNKEAIGVGVGSVVAHLKKNVDLQQSMRQLYMGLSADQMSVKVTPQEHIAKVKNETIDITHEEGKVYLGKDGKPLDVAAILKAFNEGDTDPGSLGRRFGKTNHFTIRKILKDNGIIVVNKK